MLSACACGFKAAVRLLLDARSDHNAQNNRPKGAMDSVPQNKRNASLRNMFPYVVYECSNRLGFRMF